MADIDDAVAKAHTHTNKSTLDKLGEDGQVIAGPTIHRCAYKVTDADVLPSDVLAHVSDETLTALIAACERGSGQDE